MRASGVIEEFSERKNETVAARILRHGRQRTADVAKHLSRRGAMQARCELANEAVSKLIGLCYEHADGHPCNVDRATGRLLVPAPWGRAGHRYFGLRRPESKVLRHHLFDLQRDSDVHPPLFTYDPTSRSWYLNIFDFPSYDRAIRYWQERQIGVKSWQTIAEKIGQ